MSELETVRSYARVFHRQWRVYTIPDGKGGRIRLFRNGIAMRTIGYFLSCVFVMLVLSALPGVGWVLGHFTPIVRFFGLPAAGAALLTLIEPDGRSAALWLASMLAHYVTPVTRSAGRAIRPTGESWVVDDGTVPVASAQVLPVGDLSGEGSVSFARPMVVTPSRWERFGGRPVARPDDERVGGRVRARSASLGADECVILEAGDRLRVRS